VIKGSKVVPMSEEEEYLILLRTNQGKNRDSICDEVQALFGTGRTCGAVKSHIWRIRKGRFKPKSERCRKEAEKLRRFARNSAMWQDFGYLPWTAEEDAQVLSTLFRGPIVQREIYGRIARAHNFRDFCPVAARRSHLLKKRAKALRVPFVSMHKADELLYHNFLRSVFPERFPKEAKK